LAFDFFTRNDVEWLLDGRGLRFDGNGVVLSNVLLSSGSRFRKLLQSENLAAALRRI
jgi:hypothetical protein